MLPVQKEIKRPLQHGRHPFLIKVPVGWCTGTGGFNHTVFAANLVAEGMEMQDIALQVKSAVWGHEALVPWLVEWCSGFVIRHWYHNST